MKFSLKQLMALVTAVAVVCAVLFALPPWLTVIVLATVMLLLPTLLIAGIVYGRRYSRAFAAGALWGGGVTPIVHGFLGYGVLFVVLEANWASVLNSDVEAAHFARIAFALVVGLDVASGLISMALYWLLRGRRQSQPTTTTPVPNYSLLYGRFESIQFDTGISKTRD